MINNITIRFSYKINGETKKFDFKDTFTDNDFSAEIKKDKERVQVNIVPNNKLEIVSLDMVMPYIYNKEALIYANGYQSWTDSREFKINEKMKGIDHIPGSIVKKYSFDTYGDYTFKKYPKKKGVFHGFSYGYIRNGNTIDFLGSISERAGYTILNHDVHEGTIVLEKDCKGLEISSNYEAFDIAFLKGNDDEVFDKYFEMMNIPKPRVDAMTGYTSWYNHYQDISESTIIDNLKSIANFSEKLDIFQIDDGFQTAVGDWLSIDKAKFPNGIKTICDEIKKDNLVPGLWLAPFACEEKSDIYQNHKDWLLKDENGNEIMGGCNWGGFYALDFYNEEVREYIRNVFDVVLNDWGFELVKLDFLYAVCILPRKDKTRGQIMCEAMDFLRQCVGDKMILGCGVPLAPAFGKVDFCRIGCDITLDFDDKLYMRLIHRERASTKNAIINSIYRRQLDGRAFLNDPDVFLLRDNNTKLSDRQKKNLAVVNYLFGNLLFTSDNVGDYTDEKTETFKAAIEGLDARVTAVERTGKLDFKVTYVKDGKEEVVDINL